MELEPGSMLLLLMMFVMPVALIGWSSAGVKIALRVEKNHYAGGFLGLGFWVAHTAVLYALELEPVWMFVPSAVGAVLVLLALRLTRSSPG